MENQEVLHEILKKLDTMDGRLENQENFQVEVRNEFKSLNGRVQSVDDRVQSLDGKVQSLDDRVQSLDDRVQSLEEESKKEFKQVKEKLDLLTRQTSNAVIETYNKQDKEGTDSKQELQFLSSKIVQLEKEVFKLNNN